MRIYAPSSGTGVGLVNPARGAFDPCTGLLIISVI